MKQTPFGLMFMVEKIQLTRPVRLTKRVSISAMHELKNPDLSDLDNYNIYGKCFKQHGHEYYLEVTVEGHIEKNSGLICDRDLFDHSLDIFFVGIFSGSDLNMHFKFTTGENLALEFYKLLKEKLMPLNVIGVRLQETPKNFFSFGTLDFMTSVF
jgi:6-pyruvoyltetrahydropterin/6-carboxytetrahydropterin synthase